MLLMSNLKFANNIGVLFDLKNKKNCKTLNDTYKILESTEIDNMFEVLCVSYNRANQTNLSTDDFIDLMDKHELGFLKITEMYKELIESIMFSGLTEEEIKDRKNLITNQK